VRGFNCEKIEREIKKEGTGQCPLTGLLSIAPRYLTVFCFQAGIRTYDADSGFKHDVNLKFCCIAFP